MVKKTSEGAAGRRSRSTLAGGGFSVASISVAADIPESVRRGLPSDEGSMTLGQLANVGGFLRLRPSELERLIA